jgi:hypothetical protein
MNPAREVKTERFSRTEGKTPAFVDGEVQTLLNSIEGTRPWMEADANKTEICLRHQRSCRSQGWRIFATAYREYRNVMRLSALENARRKA